MVMSGGGQVLNAFAVEVARSQNATSERGQIATVATMVLMTMVVEWVLLTGGLLGAGHCDVCCGWSGCC